MADSPVRGRLSLDDSSAPARDSAAKGGAGMDRKKALLLSAALVILGVGGYLVFSELSGESPAGAPVAEAVTAGGPPTQTVAGRPASSVAGPAGASGAAPSDPAAARPAEIRRVGGRIVPKDSPEKPK